MKITAIFAALILCSLDGLAAVHAQEERCYSPLAAVAEHPENQQAIERLFFQTARDDRDSSPDHAVGGVQPPPDVRDNAALNNFIEALAASDIAGSDWLRRGNRALLTQMAPPSQVMVCFPFLAAAIQRAATQYAVAISAAEHLPEPASPTAACQQPLLGLATNALNRIRIEQVAVGVAKNVLSRQFGGGQAAFENRVIARTVLWLAFVGTGNMHLVDLLPAGQRTWSRDAYPDGSDDLTQQVLACFPSVAAAIAPQLEAAKTQRPISVAEKILKGEYQNYIFVKRCYDARQGYMTVYISDVEMVRAKTAITKVEEKIKPKLPPGVTTDAVWSQAETDEAKSAPGGGALTLNQMLQQQTDWGQSRLCHDALNALFDAQAHVDPTAGQVQKDFP